MKEAESAADQGGEEGDGEGSNSLTVLANTAPVKLCASWSHTPLTIAHSFATLRT